MKVCTFFGHRDCPESVMEDLRTVVRELIDREGVQASLVGEQGVFDRQAYRVLREMKEEFPHIRVETVPAYFLREKREGQFVLPEGVECVPPRYAIDRRNRWMLMQADYSVCYVERGWGGAAKYMRIAQKQRKTVLNLFQAGMA